MAAKPGYQLDEDDKEAVAEFGALVNMTSRELEGWLRSGEAGEVEESSLRVVSVLGKRRVDYNVGDIAYMRKTVGYINRLLSQRPPAGAADPEWRQALMRWGHDPGKGAPAEKG